jgi:hypothetical protein
MDYTKVVNANVGELRASRYFADSPNAGRSCLESFVDLDVAAIGHLNAGQFQSDVLRVWPSATRDKQMSARKSLFSPVLFDNNGH